MVFNSFSLFSSSHCSPAPVQVLPMSRRPSGQACSCVDSPWAPPCLPQLHHGPFQSLQEDLCSSTLFLVSAELSLFSFLILSVSCFCPLSNTFPSCTLRWVVGSGWNWLCPAGAALASLTEPCIPPGNLGMGTPDNVINIFIACVVTANVITYLELRKIFTAFTGCIYTTV